MRIAVLLLLAGCAQAASGDGRTPAEMPAETGLFDGRIVPTNATDLHAPQNVFRVANWSSDSGWAKLVELVDEGTEVKAGDVVARFEFRGIEALPRINERIRQARADSAKRAIELEAERRTLESERDKRVLAAERAQLDTLKAGVVSERQLALYGIERDIARFEADAMVERLAVHGRHAAATRAWHAEEVGRAEAQMTRFEAYKHRFELRAPHAGVVRHAFLPHERRKVKKGDGMAVGRHVLSIARDEQLSVRFFVPEHRAHELVAGRKVRVRVPTSGDDVPAVVRSVDQFPQEMGFLLEDERRPDAREKAFVVVADFTGPTGELAAGHEIRVGL